jgi:hypothetical protein
MTTYHIDIYLGVYIGSLALGARLPVQLLDIWLKWFRRRGQIKCGGTMGVRWRQSSIR